MNDLSRRIQWHAGRWLTPLGLPGLAGAVLLVMTAFFYWQVQHPEALAVRDMADASETLRRKVAEHHEADKPDATPETQLDRFYRFFPEARGDALPEALAQLYATAAAENLTLDQGEYRLSGEPAGTRGQLQRYDITLPVKGNYVRLRRFLANSLKATPNLALTGISFNRQTVGDIGVDAQVRLTLYLRATEAAGATGARP